MKNQGEKSLSQGWQAQWPALRRGKKSLPTSLYKREEFGKGKGGVKAYPLATLSRWGFDGRA